MTRSAIALSALLFTAAHAWAAQAPDRRACGLADLAWIAGDWRGEVGGGTIEEQWSAPAGGSMMGMFRYVKDGTTHLYEFLTIEQGTNGPVLRLKHFNPGLVGWEEKAEAVTCPLVHAAPNEAVFDSGGENLVRLTFRRAGDTLTVTLDRKKDGKASASEFRYALVKG
jgi:hypothetical protein